MSHQPNDSCCRQCRELAENQRETLKRQEKVIRNLRGRNVHAAIEREMLQLRAALVVQQQAAVRWHLRAKKLAKLARMRIPKFLGRLNRGRHVPRGGR